ncbi:MAG TPA: PRC-barrel domain-containing protein [Gaiellaceae bacterium]|nr:PRC-barrel domain-containing protein [Gaiellaceae bacterium]
MTKANTAALVRLDDTDLTVADPAEDVRGRPVRDRDGEEIGEVKSLLIDESERKVRFLEVESGGVLGVGGERRLLPVDAVVRVEEDAVRVDQTREHVHGAPAYDPQLAYDVSYYGDIYGYYGHTPYWTAGYMYPTYPFYP